MKPAVMFAKAVDFQLGGKPEEAKSLYKKLLRAYPTNSEVLGNLAVLIKNDGLVPLAEQMLKRAINANPQNFSAMTTLANIRLMQKRYDEAKEYTDTALTLAPDFPEALLNRGVILVGDNKLDEAEAVFWRALQLSPTNANAKINFANIRRLKKVHIEQSIDMLKSVADEQPDNLQVYLTLAHAYQDNFQSVKALNAAYRALEISNGTHEDTLCSIATIHVILGELELATEFYSRATALSPDSAAASTAFLFTLNYDHRKSAADVFAEYQQYGSVIAKGKTRYSHAARPKIENRKIKIAYSSPDLYSHVVSFFIEPILRNHDKSQFEVHAYANVIKPDVHTVHLKRYFDNWVDVVQMNDAELAQRIHDDGIDILVDLAGHTYGNRLAAIAMKPAPIQATYLGFGYTTGLDAVDYFIGDKNFVPEGSEPYFSEKVIRIEAPVYAYNPPRGRIPDVAPLPALEKGYVTFGTMSRMIRLNSRMLLVWKQIIDRVPGSKLRFDQKTFEDKETIERFYCRLEALGFERSRVELVSTSPHWDGYHQFDIALDCWPHNAGTTTFEALFLGVPVISKRDRVSVGRLSDMVLSPLGLHDWVVDTEEQFVEKAVAMASDLPALAERRASLRKHVETSAFFDFRARTRGLEAGYLEMVRRYNEERE